jgi:hypothetical protein
MDRHWTGDNLHSPCPMRVTIAKRAWLLLAGAASVAVVATLLMRYVPSQSTSTRGGEPRHANRAAAALATETKEVAVARPEEIPADARRLLDEDNLFLAFERARSSTRPDAWWIARQIVDQCNMFTSDSQERNEIDRTVGELNSTNTMAPDRVEQLRRTEKRRAALEEVEKRCNGFRSLGRPWAVTTMRSLETQVKESGGVIGSLLRATELVESGGGSYSAWIQAISAAIGSGNRVAGELAIRAMGAARRAASVRSVGSSVRRLAPSRRRIVAKPGRTRTSDILRHSRVVRGQGLEGRRPISDRCEVPRGIRLPRRAIR